MSARLDAPRPPGLFASVRQLLDTLLQVAQVRLALLANELEAQRLLVLRGLVLALVGAAMLGIALLLACAFVIVLFWDQHRLAAIAVLTIAFGAGGALALRSALRGLRDSGHVLGATLRELARDRAALAGGAEEVRP